MDGEPLEDFVADISLEQVVDLVDADTILLMRSFDGTDQAEENFESVTESAVWEVIPAVERGDVIVLDLQPASGSYGFAGLEQTLDRLIEELSR